MYGRIDPNRSILSGSIYVIIFICIEYMRDYFVLAVYRCGAATLARKTSILSIVKKTNYSENFKQIHEKKIHIKDKSLIIRFVNSNLLVL